jgi:hypothetical protein
MTLHEHCLCGLRMLYYTTRTYNEYGRQTGLWMVDIEREVVWC